MEFRDLKKQYQVLKADIDTKVQSVCANAHYISGPEVKELEQELAEYVGVKHCITCANGTDAITLALKAWGIGKGDAVFVPDFTFFSSGECPASEDATCFFVDVDERTYNINPVKLEETIIRVKNEGKYTPKVVVAVDLFGLPADYTAIKPICEKYGLLLLEDGAQGFGGELNGKKTCSFGDIATTSFFPAKPLGCYGDGGAIFTNNDEWAALLRSYAVHGKAGDDKYNNIRLGLNSRLDTIQAAILQVKLKAFKDYEVKDINRVAEFYTEEFKLEGLDKKLVLPEIKSGFLSSWAQYTVQLPENVDRNDLQAKLKAVGIPSMVYYMKPMHKQGAYEGTDSAVAECPVTEKLCKTVLSFPLHPYMEAKDVSFIVEKIKEALA
ncbi:MAG: DegT/DnrJ/EryC1/StrS family aminotransferase [Spirochaetaceae bacterium]|nr:DegT/DnrJ/EryC1/StrS family aminotransferase [Spirochaetaceae bacterium]